MRDQPVDDIRRRSGFLTWLRSRLGVFGGIAGAVSHADLGPYAGAPRNPSLRIDEERYSTVRYTTHHIAHVATAMSSELCPDCGQPVAETHEIQQMQGDDVQLRVGAVRACRACEPDSWLLRSQTVAALRAREAGRKNVV
jgi:hypothetical protein